ncbi:hypothetical protein D3C81_528420 [compost metagenome]
MAVFQPSCADVKVGSADQALDIAQALGNHHVQALAAKHAAIVIVQAAGVEGEGLGAGNFTGAVAHLGEVAQ